MTQQKIIFSEIINKIFRDSETLYGLTEFSDLNIENILKIFEKEASQTAQPKISDLQVENFLIPILPKDIQQKIADLVRKSHAARQKSKELLETAKRKVEKLIEEGN